MWIWGTVLPFEFNNEAKVWCHTCHKHSRQPGFLMADMFVLRLVADFRISAEFLWKSKIPLEKHWFFLRISADYIWKLFDREWFARCRNSDEADVASLLLRRTFLVPASLNLIVAPFWYFATTFSNSSHFKPKSHILLLLICVSWQS